MLPEPDRPVHAVRLEALEPLLFGDNRPARAGLDAWQADQDPSPLTVHGAIGRALAGPRGRGEWPSAVLGDELDDILRPGDAPVAQLLGWCYQDAGGRLLFPRPLHLRCRKRHGGGVVAQDLLLPRPVAAGKNSAGSAQLVWAADKLDQEHEGPVFLAMTTLRDVLTGLVPQVGVVPEDEIFRREPRPGIAVDNDRGTVFEGYSFTRPYRRLEPGSLDPKQAHEPGVHAWFQTLGPVPAANPASAIGFLGGDRRRVRLSFAEGAARRSDVLPKLRLAVEEAATRTESLGFFLYLLTPAVAVDGAPPHWPDFGTPVASAVGKTRFASGWNAKAGEPRKLLALVPAGSVYFYPWPPEAKLALQDRAEWIRRRWLAAIQPVGAAAGFGRVLVGVW